jgi:hypothetical protein
MILDFVCKIIIFFPKILLRAKAPIILFLTLLLYFLTLDTVDLVFLVFPVAGLTLILGFLFDDVLDIVVHLVDVGGQFLQGGWFGQFRVFRGVVRLGGDLRQSSRGRGLRGFKFSFLLLDLLLESKDFVL